MSNLDFSTNWNGKLHCQIFHTLRRSGRFNIGDKAGVSFGSKLLGVAECIDKTRYDDIRSVHKTHA